MAFVYPSSDTILQPIKLPVICRLKINSTENNHNGQAKSA